jgi:hypothetical protein
MMMPTQTEIDALEQRLNSLGARHVHDAVMLVSIKHALASARQGGFAGGAVLTSPDGSTIIWEGNYHSLPQATEAEGADRSCVMYMLFEPCSGCYGHLLLGTWASICYVTAVDEGGMVHEPHPTEPSWYAMMGRRFQQADCSEELRELVLDIAKFNDHNFNSKH